MPINEIFARPIVKRVAFEMKFPNLFFIESRIGDFQIKVMREFPESSLVITRQLTFADADPKKLAELLTKQGDESSTSKAWQFTSPDGVELRVSTSALVVVSTKHKSYRQGPAPFREKIETVTRAFLSLTQVPLLTRVGLRYIDEVPIDDVIGARFGEFFNTSLPIARFPLDRSSQLRFSGVVDCAACKLRFQESLQDEDGRKSLTLDYDAWQEKVDSGVLMATIDALHEQIADEFLRTVREPMLDFMRTPEEAKPDVAA